MARSSLVRIAGVSLVILAVVCAASTPCAARADSRLVLAQPVVPDPVPTAVRREIVVKIAEGLGESGLEVSVDPFAAGACDSPSCLVDMARAHSARGVVLTTVVAEGRNYEVRLQLVDGRNGHTVGTVQQVCNFCAYDELGAVGYRAARALVRTQHREPARSRRSLRLTRRRQAHGVGPVPWIAAGLGVALGTAGVVLLALDGNCASRNPGGDCSGRRETTWLGAAAIGAGSLLLGAGGSLIVFAPTSSPRGRVMGAQVSAVCSF